MGFSGPQIPIMLLDLIADAGKSMKNQDQGQITVVFDIALCASFLVDHGVLWAPTLGWGYSDSQISILSSHLAADAHGLR